MIRVNMDSGETISFDLSDSTDVLRWEEAQKDSDFQASISAIQVVVERVDRREPDGTMWVKDAAVFVLPKPPFPNVTWTARTLVDKRKNRISRIIVECYADLFKVSLTAYTQSNPPMARADISRPGKLRLKPPGVE